MSNSSRNGAGGSNGSDRKGGQRETSEELVAKCARFFRNGKQISLEDRRRLVRLLPRMDESGAKAVARTFGNSSAKNFDRNVLAAGLLLGEHFWDVVHLAERGTKLPVVSRSVFAPEEVELRKVRVSA